MPMEEGGAEARHRAAMVQCRCPESPHMVPIRRLIFIHESEWAREGFGEGDSLSGQTFRQAVDQKLQHVATPGESSAVPCRFAGRQEFSVPFHKIGFDCVADIVRSQSGASVHASV